jgi:poly(A) polymerase
MIKKFIDKILGKRTAVQKTAAGAAKTPASKSRAKTKTTGRIEIDKATHGIDRNLVDERAIKVVDTLVEAGFEAYIVGGAVRDLLLGLRPKDFDVATNATPEQVKEQFRRAFIIGKRFRIVHVVFGRGRQDRGLSEVIEVSTFRALLDADKAEQIGGNERTSRHELAGKSSAVDASGRVLRDNVWGSQLDDAARRDFTINAMYYDPLREIVVDYHHGLDDARQSLLRMIGDPATRYREDPVRIIRAVRFAAKLGFEIEPQTRAPIRAMASLLEGVPQSRLFDEMIKLLQTGHAVQSIEELRKQGLHQGVFPVLDGALNVGRDRPHAGHTATDDFDQDAHQHAIEPRHQVRAEFIHLALADTDRRVAEGKPVSPSFTLSCLLWHEVFDLWQALQTRGEHPFPALQEAIESVFDARIGDISGRGRLAGDMREIWMMQPRFKRRTAHAAQTLIKQPRFRASWDFLRLRSQVGEIEPELVTWWEDFSLATEDTERQEALLKEAQEQEAERKRLAALEAGGVADEGAPKKKRRRKRKPAGASSDHTGTETDAEL